MGILKYHTLEKRNQMLLSLNLYDYEDLLFAIISDVLFFLKIRIVDILCLRIDGFNHAKQLCRDSVLFHSDRAQFMWRNDVGEVSKTGYIMRTNSVYDTVAMLERMYILNPTLYPQQPLFTRVFRGKTVPAIRSWFIYKYKKVIKKF